MVSRGRGSARASRQKEDWQEEPIALDRGGDDGWRDGVQLQPLGSWGHDKDCCSNERV